MTDNSQLFTLKEGKFTERLLRRKEVVSLTSLPSSTLTDYIKKGLFPKPFKPTPEIGGKHGISLWKLSEIEEWMANLQRAQ